MMVALGIDVSSTKLAFGALDENGGVVFTVGSIATHLRGARKLVEVRKTTEEIARLSFPDTCVAVIEIPWGSFLLLSVAAVVLEAVQHALPDAVVLERNAQSWKANSVGHGNASKAEVLEHAQGLGYQGDDQDVADALAMACAGWAEWWRMEASTA